MMINTDLGWGKFWVIFGLLGYAATFTVGDRRARAAREADHTRRSRVTAPKHPETIALIKHVLLIARFDIAVLLLVVADMVTKPFS